MNKRRTLFLVVWTFTWLGLPAVRPALLAAVTGSLVAYVVLQVTLVTREEKHRDKPASMS
jgi:O-antigen/teichoic acid export membrane protein